MAIQRKNLPYTALQSMLGGFRVMISEPGSGANLTGMRYLGTVFEPKWQQTVEYYEHFETASGAKVLDRKLPKQIGLKVAFKLDDLFAKNLERYFLAKEMTAVAANAAAAKTAELFIAGKTDALHGLSEGRQTDLQKTALAVYNVTDAALLVENTDYAKVRYYGWTFIKMLVNTHAGDVIRVGVGATAVTDYNYNELGYDAISPLTRYEREVRGILQAPSKTGGNWEYYFEKAILSPDGEFDLNVEQASSIQMALDFKDNSANDAANPFGVLRHRGYDDTGLAVV